jgi:hypothetical protein
MDYRKWLEVFVAREEDGVRGISKSVACTQDPPIAGEPPERV